MYAKDLMDAISEYLQAILESMENDQNKGWFSIYNGAIYLF